MTGKDVIVQVLNKVLNQLGEKVRLIPHRDVTISPYKDWFEFYVQGLQQFHQSIKLELLGPKGNASFLSPALQQYRTQFDAVLLSSLFAKNWHDVYLSSGNLSASEENESQRNTQIFGSELERNEWVLHATEGGWKTFSSEHSAEFCTPEYMTEPLLGGEIIPLYLNLLKQLRDSSPSSTMVANGCLNDSLPTRLVVPFSTLWELKSEAYGHDTRVPPKQLSVQERKARETMLRHIHYSVQFTSSRGGKASIIPADFPLLHLVFPSEEFDALCHLPRLRRIKPLSSAEGSSLFSRWTMQGICEQPMQRLCYLSHAFSVLSSASSGISNDSNSPQHSKKATEVVLLAPSYLHSAYRKLNSPALRDHSTALQNVILPNGSTVIDYKKHLRQSQLDERKAVARRLTTREENIRQAFTLK